MSPGQPNRRPRSEVPPTDPTGRARALPHGLGGAEIGDGWVDTNDARILKDRLRRREAQVEKLKRDRAELKVAMRLKTEEAYNEGLLSVAPTLLEIDQKIAELAHRILDAPIGGDELRLLKPLLVELGKMRDRLYGKTRQRVQSTSLSASVDINELQRQSRAALGAGAPGPETAGEDVVDVEPEDEEMIDE